MNSWQGLRLLAMVLSHRHMAALRPTRSTSSIDYTYDTNNFFGSGNPQGAAAGMQAKAALEAAAELLLQHILNDTFSAITIPPPYHSTFPVRQAS